MVKQADQLGASLLGNVAPRVKGNSFSSAESLGNFQPNIIDDSNNRLLQGLIDRGIKILDKSIDARLEEEMVRGSTLAMAGVAESKLETSILTRNFTIAGHRNMTAKMHYQEWQSQILDEVAKGEHNNSSPTEFADYLNTSMKGVLEDVNGMSREAKSSMLENILTGNQTLVAQQTKFRAESIVNASMGLYSMQANTLLEQAKINQGTELEGASIQQMQALVRSIETDPNLTPELRNKFIGEIVDGSAKMGLVGVTRGVRGTILGYNEDGSPIRYQDKMSLDQYTSSMIEERKALEANKLANNTQGRLEFTELQAQLDNNTFMGTQDDLVSGLIFARNNGIISEGEATSMLKKYAHNQYLNRYASQSAELYRTNNIAGMQGLKVSYDDAKKAYIQEGIDMGMTLDQQVSRINTTFKLSNGDTNAVDWISSDILKPILNEVINSDGDILTENGQLFNHIISEIANVDETKQGLYVASLLQSLDTLQSDFVMRFIGEQQKGADAETALSRARVSYLRSVDAKESDRSEVVRASSKNIEKVLDQFSDVSMFNNFFGNRTVGKLWNTTDQAKTIIGSPTAFRTAHNTAVSQAYTSLANGLETDLKEYVRQTGRVMEESELQTFVAKEVLNRIKGENGNSVVFDSKDRLPQMFPNAITKELEGQENELVGYVIGKLSEQDGYSNVVRSYTFSDGMLKVNIIGEDGQYIPREYSPETYLHLVEDFKFDRLNKVQGDYWTELASKMEEASKRTKTSFQGNEYNFNTGGYNNARDSYSRNFMNELYQEVIPLEGFETTRYADGSGGRYSIGLGVNSINATDSRYKPYFDIEKRQGYLTQYQAEQLSEIAVKDHLDKTARFMSENLSKAEMNKSEDLKKGLFKLIYTQGSIDKQLANKLITGVKEGKPELIIEGLNSSNFFKMSVGSNENHPHYQYILSKLIGAMDDFSAGGIR